MTVIHCDFNFFYFNIITLIFLKLFGPIRINNLLTALVAKIFIHKNVIKYYCKLVQFYRCPFKLFLLAKNFNSHKKNTLAQ